MASPGDRPDLPLEEEPLPFLHPRDAGTSAPVHPAGAREGLLLEEEPAEWIAFSGDPRPALRRGGGGGSPPGPRDDRRGLPATGRSVPTALAIGSLAAAWSLRRRRRGRSDGPR